MSSRVGPAPRPLDSQSSDPSVMPCDSGTCAWYEWAGWCRDSGRCVSLAFLRGGKCSVGLEPFLPFLERRWRRGLYPARCVGRKNEFMAWVNDPCSPHHWVVGTGGQSQADRPGNEGDCVRRHQLRSTPPTPREMGHGVSHPTIPTLVRTLISIHPGHYNYLLTGPRSPAPSSPKLPPCCWQSWVYTGQTCSCHLSPENPSSPSPPSAEPNSQAGSQHLVPTYPSKLGYRTPFRHPVPSQ